MAQPRRTLRGLSLLAVFFTVCGVASAATSYPEQVGDVERGGPDIASIRVSNTKATVAFRVRFARAPPLRVSTREGWVDMLLIGIDVPPLGPRPAIAGGPWPGANFALGTHGPSKTGSMVRLGQGVPAKPSLVVRFKIVSSGPTLTFSIPRRALGDPARFTFSVAAAREMENEAAGGSTDVAPGRGTFVYRLTR